MRGYNICNDSGEKMKTVVSFYGMSFTVVCFVLLLLRHGQTPMSPGLRLTAMPRRWRFTAAISMQQQTSNRLQRL